MEIESVSCTIETIRSKLLTSVTVVDRKEAPARSALAILDVDDGGVRILHADTPSLHVRDGKADRVILASDDMLFRDGLGESLTHFWHSK